MARVARNDFTLHTRLIEDRTGIFAAVTASPSDRGELAVDHLDHFAMNFKIAFHNRTDRAYTTYFLLYFGFGV